MKKEVAISCQRTKNKVKLENSFLNIYKIKKKSVKSY